MLNLNMIMSVDIKTPKPTGNFISLFEPKLRTIAGEQDFKCFKIDSFAASFMHLKLRRDHNRCHGGGEARQGWGYRMVNKIMCSPEGG